jgi:hypothetical protein
MIVTINKIRNRKIREKNMTKWVEHTWLQAW